MLALFVKTAAITFGVLTGGAAALLALMLASLRWGHAFDFKHGRSDGRG